MGTELRDPREARRYVVQSLWLSRALAPTAENAPATLRWCLEIALRGNPLPPVGFIADVGNVAQGAFHEHLAHSHADPVGLAAEVVRKYEDYVLGKFYSDLTFERGADALLRYQGHDRDLGLAFLVEQMQSRCGFGGGTLSPSVIKSLLHSSPRDVLAEGWDSLEQTGIMPALVAEYDTLIAAMLRTGECLGAEDIFELEQGTALSGFGQRLALRQVLQTVAEYVDGLPKTSPRASSRHHLVATRILDEDQYPVGGFSSISTRGSIESLLHSQLALMETGRGPDQFDVRFARDELLYYSRDENQFLRRRQTFVFALHANLVHARIKDPELPRQRIVLILAALVAAQRTLTMWLSQEALRFEFVIVSEGAEPLATEAELLEILCRDEIRNDTVEIARESDIQFAMRCERASRHSLCHVLAITTHPFWYPEVQSETLSRFVVARSTPQGNSGDGTSLESELSGPEAWTHAVHTLLRGWL